MPSLVSTSLAEPAVKYLGPKTDPDDLATQSDLGSGGGALPTHGAALTTQTTISTSGNSTLASVNVPPGLYIVTAQFDWLSVTSTGTFAAIIAGDFTAKRQLYVGNGTTIGRVGQSLIWVGEVTTNISIMASRPLGTGNALLGATNTRLDAIRIG